MSDGVHVLRRCLDRGPTRIAASDVSVTSNVMALYIISYARRGLAGINTAGANPYKHGRHFRRAQFRLHIELGLSCYRSDHSSF